MQRQEMLESLMQHATYLNDSVLSSLVDFVRNLRYEGYTTQDDDSWLDAENAQAIREGLRDIEQGNTVKVTIEELEQYQ